MYHLQGPVSADGGEGRKWSLCYLVIQLEKPK